MRRSRVLEERRKRVNPETRESVALSFRIVDRIHDVLEEKGLIHQHTSLNLWWRRSRNKANRPPCFQGRILRP